MISCLLEVRACNGGLPRWLPSAQEKMLMKRLTRVRALFGFFRQHRRELFDDAFQDQPEGMYWTPGVWQTIHIRRILRSAGWCCSKALMSAASDARRPLSCPW